MKWLTNLDLNKNELQNVRLQNLGAAPSSPVSGQVFFNSGDKHFYGWNGTAWINLGQVLTGDSIIALINGSSLKIDDDNLSANVADALVKRHSHSNMDVLNAMEVAFTNALKTKLDGISSGANKVEQSATNGNIKIDGVEKTVYSHPGSGTNPHGTTKEDLGLSNVENKSSSTIRSEINSENVTEALGYTPIKNGGNTPELISGLESSRPTANGSGLIYFATDTKKIWKDTAIDTWTQMGGQDLPIASASVLGGIKVGANLTINEDGTLNANDNPASFIIKQEVFTVESGQTVFTLNNGTYKPGTNSLFWYMFGQKQPNDALIETSPATFQIAGDLDIGTDIIVEYIEIINANPYPEHADEHLTGGVDPIPKVTDISDGLMAKEDKNKLDGIEAESNKYIHPTGDGNSHVPVTGTTNNGKVLKAGATEGSIGWGTLSPSDVGAVPDSDIVTTPTPNKILRLNSVGDLPADITGNAETASRLATARSISLTGDAAGSTMFDGSANKSIAVTLSNSGVTAGTYPKVTVDAKGRVTGGSDLEASDIPEITLSKISDAGSAASKNTGTSPGEVPVLDVNGKIDTSILPAIAISDTFVVNSQSAMLALIAEVGDVCVRTDLNKSFILKNSPSSELANWQELLTPADAVSSVNGKTGAVTLTASDVGLGNVTNESKATMFTSPSFTGTPTAPTPVTSDNSIKIATTGFVKAQGYLTSVPVTSVAGKTGAVTLEKADVGLGNVENKSSATIRSELSKENVTDALEYTPPNKFAANVGDGVNTVFNINHGLNTMDIALTLREAASPYEVVMADMQLIDANNVQLLFAVAPTSNQYRLTVVG